VCDDDDVTLSSVQRNTDVLTFTNCVIVSFVSAPAWRKALLNVLAFPCDIHAHSLVFAMSIKP